MAMPSTSDKFMFGIWMILIITIDSTRSKDFSSLDNGQFRTPPMGWLSWARFRCNIDCKHEPRNCINEKLYKDMADRMAADGWKDAGYSYISVDDCWESLDGRDPQTNRLVPDPIRFPSGMKSLGEYIHSKGLKFGIYSDVGEKTCGGYPGSYGYFDVDAKTFAEWGVDSLKLDGCNIDTEMMPIVYPQMAKALNESGRSIAYICSWPAYVIGQADYMEIKKSCNSWRNYRDIDDTWETVNSIITWFADEQELTTPAAGPGAWNDPDMLVIGNFGLSHGQAKIQMALWAIMAAPLMMSNDLRSIPTDAKEILLNKDVIAVNQDPLGIQGKRILTLKTGKVEVWTRALQDNQLAVAFVRRFSSEPYFPSEYSVRLDQIGWKSEKAYTKDLFTGVTKFSEKNLVVTVDPFGVTMIRLSSVKPAELSNFVTKMDRFSTCMFLLLGIGTVGCIALLLIPKMLKRRNYDQINDF